MLEKVVSRPIDCRRAPITFPLEYKEQWIVINSIKFKADPSVLVSILIDNFITIINLQPCIIGMDNLIKQPVYVYLEKNEYFLTIFYQGSSEPYAEIEIIYSLCENPIHKNNNIHINMDKLSGTDLYLLFNTTTIVYSSNPIEKDNLKIRSEEDSCVYDLSDHPISNLRITYINPCKFSIYCPYGLGKSYYLIIENTDNDIYVCDIEYEPDRYF